MPLQVAWHKIQDKQLIQKPICALNSQHGSGEGENDSGAITVPPCRFAKELTEQEDTRSR